ncbi:hypothetical protein Q8A67_006449 [Cirrhinus molitorella]|uniref:Uncharacterized protein n=1 Tax=Cirrhinus molitorella TaxID=172907 RepID=A0AA88PUD3_9TELE|nr:hypothetical protein Q8A67_006449 [Cirrhinus molitorella]
MDEKEKEEEEEEPGVKLHQFHCFEKRRGGGAKSLSDTKQRLALNSSLQSADADDKRNTLMKRICIAHLSVSEDMKSRLDVGGKGKHSSDPKRGKPSVTKGNTVAPLRTEEVHEEHMYCFLSPGA